MACKLPRSMTTPRNGFTNPAIYNLNIAGMWIARAAPVADRRKGRPLDRARLQPSLWPLRPQGMGPRLQHDHRQEPLLAGHRQRACARRSKRSPSRCWTLRPPSPNMRPATLDSTGVPIADIDRVRADPELSEQLDHRPRWLQLLLRLQHHQGTGGQRSHAPRPLLRR